MAETVILCERVGKRYQIGDGLRYRTLRDAIAEIAAAPWRAFRNNGADRNSIWSLRDVSFAVGEGELLGIIGRNGAGKSTLLRLLAGITHPTEGRIAVRGRVGSLLEVGTGFHPELTGRENIYLSGAVLGIARRDIQRQFDAIVAFAEIEPFLDTPVKRYSSGMYTRLAFAVAAHLETEILLVDEILAVGDAVFQRRCLDVMGNLASRRRAVLFVSHDLGAVQRLCPRALLLEGGRIVAEGSTGDVVVQYLGTTSLKGAPEQRVDLENVSRRGTGEARFVEMIYASPDNRLGGHPFTNGPFEVKATIESSEEMRVDCMEVFIRDHRGIKLIDADIALLGQSVTLARGRSTFHFRIEKLSLNPGFYHIGLWLARRPHDGIGIDHVDPAARMEVLAEDTSQLIGYSPSRGPVACPFTVEPLMYARRS